jgi:hypothetical protein
MFFSVAQYFCALVIFLACTAWEPSTVQASCADGKPEPRVTCAYPTIGSTISNEAAKSDSLLIKEVPSVARRLTRMCLQADQAGATASQECWQSAAVDARRFTRGLTGTAADELRALAAVWADLAQRLKQERESIMAAAEASAIEPASDSWKPQDFSSARMSKPARKRKIATRSAEQVKSVEREKPIRQASVKSPQVRKAKLKTKMGKKRFALAWRKDININKTRARKRRPVAKVNGLKCLFSPKSCKQ